MGVFLLKEEDGMEIFVSTEHHPGALLWSATDLALM